MEEEHRVLYICCARALGGAERSLLELVATIRSFGFRLDVVLPGEGSLHDGLNALGAKVHSVDALNWRRGGSYGIGSILSDSRRLRSASAAISRIAAHRRIDILHANSTKAACAAMWSSLNQNLPMIWHVRDHAGMLETRILTTLGAVPIAISSSGAMKLKRILGHAPALIANGIDLTALESTPTCVPRERQAVRIVCVAHWAPWKGHELLLDAFERCQRICDFPLHLSLVGGDLFRRERLLSERLAARAAAFQDSVELVGPTNNVVQYLRSADILVHPAYPEPFGRVIVEALSVGLPVIAFDGEHGPADIIRTVGGGILVSPRTAEALAQAIQTVANDLPKYRGRALAALSRTRLTYSSTRVASEVASLYATLLGHREIHASP